MSKFNSINMSKFNSIELNLIQNELIWLHFLNNNKTISETKLFYLLLYFLNNNFKWN
jgi:hypothetical protein